MFKTFKMKKTKIMIIASVVALLTGCDPDVVIYDGSEGAKGLTNFENTSYSLPINVDDVGSLDIKVFVSTISSVDRTFNIEVDTETSTAVPGSVNVPTSVTIPANAYEGMLRLNGTDVPGVDTNAELLVIRLVGDGNIVAGPAANISVFQVCPIPATYFIGSYTLTNLSGVVGPGNGTTNYRNGVVTVTAPSPTSRSFSTAILPGFRPAAVPTVLGLVCNTIVFNETGPTPGLGCVTGNVIRYGQATTPSTYNIADDTLFIINYNEDITGSCGGPFENQSFLLTKN